MNILMVGANCNNSTDGVIVLGIHNLLKAALGKYEYDYAFLDDDRPQAIVNFNPTKYYDAVVVCGTPWLWDSFQNSTKYRNLKTCFNLHFRAKKLFLGIGSCLNIKDQISDILERPDEVAGMRDLFQNATVITRDTLAHEKLNYANVSNTLLPCPAYFCYGINPKMSTINDYNVLVYTDPTKTISGADWHNEQKLRQYNDLIMYFYTRFSPKVFIANEKDALGAWELGLPSPNLLITPFDTLNVMEESGVVLSTRVHCAVPAVIQQKLTFIVPLDTRARVLTDLYVPEVSSKTNFFSSNIRPINNPMNKLDQYIETIKTAVL